MFQCTHCYISSYTWWRASLTPAALSDPLTVLLLSPDVEEYDPTPAINLWVTESVRMQRPNLMDKDNPSHILTLSMRTSSRPLEPPELIHYFKK